MKKVLRILLPLLLIALILGSIGWYLFVYDRGTGPAAAAHPG